VKHILLLTAILLAFAFNANAKNNKIDDWEYNHTKKHEEVVYLGKGAATFNMPRSVAMAAPAPKMLKVKKLGFSAGGAKDANNFYENIKHNYLPKLDSITYEGVFYDHYFNAPSSNCKELFCPSFQTAVRENIFTSNKDYFLSIGLDSNIDIAKFKRKKLNLVVVLDISGSMSASFNSYYYDKKRHLNEHKSKMQIANESIASMLDKLKPKDSFGVVLFDNRAYLAKPLRDIATTNTDAIKKHILELTPQGGTNWSAGYKKGLELLKEATKSPEVENRIIFITDAMPNRGELAKDRLFGMIKSASKSGIYTTVIGVGVDFNNNLVEYISKTKGANYLSVHSSKEFKKRVNKEFDYLVTPLVFDLKLEFISKAYKIKKVYGTATNQSNPNTLIEVNTLFPSTTNEQGIKGGVILAQLNKIDSGKITLKVSYKDRFGKSHSSIKELSFKDGKYFDSKSIKKAILLTDYVNIIKNWLADTRKSCNDKVHNYPPVPILKSRCIYPPILPPSIKTWERKSCKLQVSSGYKKLFGIFLQHFKKEANSLGDKSLKKEQKALEQLIKKESPKHDGKVDDWKM